MAIPSPVPAGGESRSHRQDHQQDFRGHDNRFSHSVSPSARRSASVDVVGRLLDTALSLVQWVARPVVEALAVELFLAGVVTPDQVRSPVLARIRASEARFVAPQAFSAAFRTSHRASISQRVRLEAAGVRCGWGSAGYVSWFMVQPLTVASSTT